MHLQSLLAYYSYLSEFKGGYVSNANCKRIEVIFYQWLIGNGGILTIKTSESLIKLSLKK